MKKILLGSLLLLFSNLANAKWYQVEMVVFEHLAADTSGEFWNTGDVPDYSRAIELVTDANGSNAFRMLPSSRYKLGGVNKVLKLSSGYRPVYHVAWQQPELTKSRAKKVHIKNPEAKINGTVNLRGGHLLHLDLDISYFVDLFTESVTSFTEEDVFEEGASTDKVREEIIMSGTYAQMKETRRIKLNELHYFDHPLFGVIMRVTRLEVE
ncbi:MAG: CsiV family protein [Gammaproteobacteria bacterium]